jgi:hypothetical protein
MGNKVIVGENKGKLVEGSLTPRKPKVHGLNGNEG